MEVTNILISGVGGQGLVMTTNIISRAAAREGYDIKTSDVIGLSQRGGLIWGCVRFGKEVPSPLIPNGQGDILLAMEQLEALRWFHLMKSNARIIINDDRIYPNRVLLEKEEYPEDIPGRLEKKGFEVYTIDAGNIAKSLGNSKVSNSVLMGFLSSFLPFSADTWSRVIVENVPKDTIDMNVDAFFKGRQYKEGLDENLYKNR